MSSEVLNAALSGLELQKRRIEEHIEEVRAMLGLGSEGQKRRGRPPKSAASMPEMPPAPKPGGSKGKRSAAVRARMAEAQRKRWAAIKAPKAAPAKTAPKKRKMSAAARKRISDATKKRWAAYKAQKAAS